MSGPVNDNGNEVLRKAARSIGPDSYRIAVDVEASALPSGAAVESKQDTQIARLDTIITHVDELEPRLGALTETAPASDTASSGLNGRLQRIAQRITSLIAFYAADFGVSIGAIRTAAQVGNATGAADFNDGVAGAQTQRTTTANRRGSLTDRSGSASTSSTQVAAANATRSYLFFHNPSGSINMWINFTSAAANAAGSIKIGPGDFKEWTGVAFIPTEALNVIAGSGTPAYTCKEG